MVERNMMMNPQNIGTSYPILKRIENIIENYISMYLIFNELGFYCIEHVH